MDTRTMGNMIRTQRHVVEQYNCTRRFSAP